MEELNVFGTRIFLAMGFCLVVFYLLGSLLIGRLKSGYCSVGAKLSFGGLFFISIVAVAHAGIQTGMLFYAVLFLVIGFRNRFRPDFSDLKEIGTLGGSIILLSFFALLIEEGYQSDLLVDGAVYVGNADVSFYGSYAHSLFQSGYETGPENYTPEMQGTIYHFGDLWFSGFFSNYFGVLPYYAYNVLFRVFALGVIILMVFGWCYQFSKQAWSAFLVAITAVLAVYMELFSLNLPDISLFQTFSFVYAQYGLGSHLIVAMAVIPFSLYILEKNWVLGTCGLLLVPFLNAGLLIVPTISMLLLGIFYLIQKFFKWDYVQLGFSETLALLAVSAVPIVYYALGDRLDSQSSNLFSVEFIYVFFHTGIRTLLSQILVVPFLVGFAWYAASKYQVDRKLFVVQSVFYVGTMVGFAFIFPQIQGNSSQILSMYFAGFLAPIGMVGLYATIHKQERAILKWLSAIFLLAIMLQSGRVFIGSEGQRATFDWESYQPGYKKQHLVPLKDWQAIHGLLTEKKTVAGYFVCDKNKSGSTHYNEFTYLKGVFPGLVFQRLNPLPKGNTKSREMQSYHDRTTLGYFEKRNGVHRENVEIDVINFSEPQFFLLPTDTLAYCIPEKWHDLFDSEILQAKFATVYKP